MSKTIKIEAVLRDEEGNAQEGVDIYWTEGSTVFLFQSWDHRAAGRDWFEVQVSFFDGNALDYFLEHWKSDGYSLVDVTYLSS